jgi:hypothetical protein
VKDLTLLVVVFAISSHYFKYIFLFFNNFPYICRTNNENMDFITFNTENTKFVDGDFIKDNDFADKVYEDGSFTLDDQWMSFDCNGVSIVVDYEISVSGSSSYDSGDYWTPPSLDIDIDSVDISVTAVNIDEYEVELTPELKKIFENLVNKSL